MNDNILGPSANGNLNLVRDLFSKSLSIDNNIIKQANSLAIYYQHLDVVKYLTYKLLESNKVKFQPINITYRQNNIIKFLSLPIEGLKEEVNKFVKTLAIKDCLIMY